MKIAVLISGEYREFDIVHKTWPFLKWQDVDIYVSTWNITTETNTRLDINIVESVDLARFQKHVSVRAASIDSPKDISHNNKMLDRWKTGLELINNSGVHYDVIIIIRPDLYLDFNDNDFRNFISNLDVRSIYTHTGRVKIVNYIQDQLIIANGQTMLKLLDLDYEKCGWNTNIHWFLAMEFKRIVGNIENIPLENFTICRSNCRNLELNFNIVYKKAREWYEAKHDHEIKISDLAGFSDAKVELFKTTFNKMFVRKKGVISRNFDQLVKLIDAGFDVPNILRSGKDYIDMEYIAGLDMRTYISRCNLRNLIDFLHSTLSEFKKDSQPKNYSNTFTDSLAFIQTDNALPFSATELYARLPKVLPASKYYHGDLTLENLIYSRNSKFVMIDVSSGVYDSYIFDIAKLRQDLDAHWFLRRTPLDLSTQLEIIKRSLNNVFPEAFDDHLYILMLLRVYKYCQSGTLEFNLILNEIKRLWK